MKCCLCDIAFPWHARDAGPIPFDFLNPGTFGRWMQEDQTPEVNISYRGDLKPALAPQISTSKKLREDKGIQRQRFYFL